MSTAPTVVTLLNWNNVVGSSTDVAHTFFPIDTTLAASFTFDGNFDGAFSGSGMVMTPAVGYNTATAQSAWTGPGGNKLSLTPTVGSISFTTRYANLYVSIINQSQGATRFVFTNPAGSNFVFSPNTPISDSGGNWTLTPTNTANSNVQEILMSNLKGATSILPVLQMDAGVGKYIPTLTYVKASGGGGQNGVVGIQFMAASTNEITPLACLHGDVRINTTHGGFVPIRELVSGVRIPVFDRHARYVKDVCVKVLKMKYMGGLGNQCHVVQPGLVVSRHHSMYVPDCTMCRCATCCDSIWGSDGNSLHRVVASHTDWPTTVVYEPLWHLMPETGFEDHAHQYVFQICGAQTLHAMFSEFYRSSLDDALAMFDVI